MIQKSSFQDTAMLFANSITTVLRQDEEYRAAWRYRHRQEAIKIPRREALKNASAWAEQVAEHLSVQDSPDTLERYTGKMWEAWVSFTEARNKHIDDKTNDSLSALKQAEAVLKAQVRAVNALLR